VWIDKYLALSLMNGVDVVINNAGAGSAGVHLSEVDPSEVMNQVNVHCAGALRVLKGAPDAVHTADDGARAFEEVIANATKGGIYHAFGDKALY